MIYLESVQLPYPSSYKPDLQPARGKHAIFNAGYRRYNKNNKFVISLGWNSLRKEEAEAIIDLYNIQMVNFNTLTFLFEKGYMGEDLGPIEVFVKLETDETLINGRKKIELTLYEK